VVPQEAEVNLGQPIYEGYELPIIGYAVFSEIKLLFIQEYGLCLIFISVGEVVIRPVELRVFKALTGTIGSSADITVPAQAAS